MKKRNLFVTVILALALSFTALAACGETTDNGGGGGLSLRPSLHLRRRRHLRRLTTRTRSLRRFRARWQSTRRFTRKR